MENKNQQQPPVNQGTAKEQALQAILPKEFSDTVMKRIKQFEEEGALRLPQNYSAENALKSAWLVLLETKDRNDKPVLDVCTKESIANALLDMVVNGLSVSKKQGYFIAHGNHLTFMRSYFGTIALAKRVGGITEEPIANVVYKDDIFEYIIEPGTGRKKIITHEQKIGNIKLTEIVGAYAYIVKGDKIDVEIMTMEQIRKAWEQGPMKGKSGAHNNFTDQMCGKTVINRGCKVAINSSDDAWLYENKKDEFDADNEIDSRNASIQQGTGKKKMAVDIPFEEIPDTLPEVQPNPIPSPLQKQENTKAKSELFPEGEMSGGPGF